MPKLVNFDNRIEIDGVPYAKNELKAVSGEGDNVTVKWNHWADRSDRAVKTDWFNVPYYTWEDGTGTPYPSKGDFLAEANTFFFNVGAFEQSLFKVTYYEIIDINSTTSGSLQETPSGAQINEDQFGDSGNAVLSTLTTSQAPTFESPVDGVGGIITVDLDTNGDWVSTDTYVDPVALIYSITISGASWSNLDFTKVIDFFDATESTLQEVTDRGNTTTNPIIFQNNTSGVILKDENGDNSGYLAGDDEFGVNLFGTTDGQNLDRPAVVGGDSLLFVGNQIGAEFSGAEEYDVLRILKPSDVNGRQIFPISPFALDYVLYSEDFTPVNVDIPLNTSFQNIIQGTTTNQYTDGSSQAVYGFAVFNNENQDITLEFSITQNDGTPTEFFTRVLPAKQSTTFIAGSDSITGGDVIAGSTVEIQVRITSVGDVTVVGSQTPITLRLEQNTAVASSGVLGQSSANGGNIRYIYSKDDFPDPVGGVITLSNDNATYIIQGDISLGSDRIVVDADNVALRGVNTGADKITSSTTNSIISGTNRGVSIEQLTIMSFTASNGISFTGSGAEIVFVNRCSFIGMQTHVFIDNINTFAEELTFHNLGTTAIYFDGNVDNILIAKNIFNSMSGALIDLDGSLCKAVGIESNTGVLQPTSTFIELAVDSGNIDTNGEGTITNNKIDNTLGGVETVGYSPLDLGWLVSGNANIIPSDRLQPNGWGFYVDDATSTQVFGDTPSQMTINGLSSLTNETKLPRVIRGIDSLWDTTGNFIKPVDIGDSYDIRIQFEIIATQSNPQRFTIALDIGATPNGTGTGGSIIIAEDSKTLKQGVPQDHIVTFPAFTLATFAANNGTLWISADSGTITVQARQILIVRTSSGAN